MFFGLFRKKPRSTVCEICGKKFKAKEVIAIKKLGPSLIEALKQLGQGYNPKGAICRGDLRKLRVQSIRMLFDKGDIHSEHVEQILLQEDDSYPYSFNEEYQNELTLGEKCSQKITPFIGSWGFVALFLAFVFFWVGYNSQEEVKEHFDPFPFILLNLFLSCMAAIQAPIIMMAHNRLAKRERLRADEDYYTNLKAELEIRQLNAKLDAFLELKKKNQT